MLVWLLADVDRIWQPELPHSVPVAYALKGDSLHMTIMRSMMEEVLQACYDEGIHVAIH